MQNRIRKAFLGALSGALTMCPVILRVGGGASGGLPKFTYTGTYTLLDDGDDNWRIKFLTSGTLVLKRTVTIDLFLVGGGGGGGRDYGAGGGGGYTRTVKSIVLQADVSYPVVVGAGGIIQGRDTTGTRGGTTSAFNYSAEGGYGGGWNSSQPAAGGNGGSGGAGYNGSGGSNGGNGTSYPGYGQGTTTREFGESAGDLYAGGGGGYDGWGGAGGGGNGVNASSPHYGTPNTGGGCGGDCADGTAGGSGIGIIRNHRAA